MATKVRGYGGTDSATNLTASSSYASLESLSAPEVEAIIESKRPMRYRVLHVLFPRSLQIALSCTSIALSAVTAQGVYCWPTYGPVVARSLDLTGPEAQTIVIFGILGTYLLAAPVGAIIDRRGPRFGSLLAAILSAIGYTSFVILLSFPAETDNLHLYLAVAYAFIGGAAVSSYFSCLTTASLSFPAYPTISLSLPLSLIGLSSLFLSLLGSLRPFQAAYEDDGGVYMDPEVPPPPYQADVDPKKFLGFLAVLVPCINLFGAVFMRVILPEPPSATETALDQGEHEHSVPNSPIQQLLHLDEHTPLLIGGEEAAREEAVLKDQGKLTDWTAKLLWKDYGFWSLGLILILCLGPAEMVVASIGSIMTSLLPPARVVISPSNSALTLRTHQIFLLSSSSTLARLLTGLVADYLCPSRMRRSTLVATCMGLLAAIFVYAASVLETVDGIWVVSLGVGWLYGALFTIIPALVSTHFGVTNFGLAWGSLMYFTAAGSVIYSYLYAVLSTVTANLISHKKAETCYGTTQCFEATFWVCAISCGVATVGIWGLGRRWAV